MLLLLVSAGWLACMSTCKSSWRAWGPSCFCTSDQMCGVRELWLFVQLARKDHSLGYVVSEWVHRNRPIEGIGVLCAFQHFVTEPRQRQLICKPWVR